MRCSEIQHEQAVRHVVERGVETICDGGEFARGQHVLIEEGAHAIRHRARRHREGQDEGGEHRMVEVPKPEKTDHDGEAGREDHVVDGARRAVVSPDHRDHGGERHRNGGDFRKGIAADEQAVAAGRAERERRADGAEIVPVLPVADAVHVERGLVRPVEAAHAVGAQRPDEHDERAPDEEEGVVGLGVDEGERDDVRNHAHKKGLAITVQRADERQVYISRQCVLTLILHGLGTPYDV